MPIATMSRIIIILTACACTVCHAIAQDHPVLPPVLATGLRACNVVWDSPSKDSFDSMPLPGSRGAGANVWVQDGALWMYLAHNSAYDEAGRLLKLGCLRITPAGVDWTRPAAFKQAQDLASGTISVESTASDGTRIQWRLRFLGESLVMDCTSSRELAWDVSFGTWRDAPKTVAMDLWGRENVGADTVAAAGSALHFIHRNGKSTREAELARGQKVPADAVLALLPDRNFGGVLVARAGLVMGQAVPVSWQTWQGMAWPGKTISAREHTLIASLGAGKLAEPAAWEQSARALLESGKRASAEKDEDRRWAEFWGRSYIHVSPGKDDNDPGFQVGRNYQLFRQMLACNQGGELPLKFNGGIFTTDTHPDRVPGRLNNPSIGVAPGGTTPDYRRWGQMFMAQNQRWLAWPTLAGGDADLLAPSTRFYRDRHAIAIGRAANIGGQGAIYVEPIGLDGTTCVAPTADGLCSAAHLTHQFSASIENAWMTLLAHDILGVNIDPDIPWMVDIVRFYDSFYRAKSKVRTGGELGPDGKLVLYPTNSLEYLSGATNAIEVVAGLRRVTAGLLALPRLAAADRNLLEKFQPTLPDLPVTQRNGKQVLAPAAKWEGEHNPWELPELYAAWPYRLVGVTRPETLAMARDTWFTLTTRGDNRSKLFCKMDFSWQANVANTAALALPDEARERAIAKLGNPASCTRYPGFFGPGHDWMPDHNWGGSGMTGLQEMLVAADPVPNGKIHLLPAWPKEWDVRFKLHTNGRTTVEGEVKDGKLVNLQVTPESRRKDIVLHELKDRPPPPAPPVTLGKPATASSTFKAGFEPALAVDGDPATRWASAYEARHGWLQVDLGSDRVIKRAHVSEIDWPETLEFIIECQQGDGWKEIARGTTIGRDMSIDFPPARGRIFRLKILKAKMAININEFQLFE